MPDSPPPARWRIWATRGGVGLVVLLAALAIPDCAPTVPQSAGVEPFVWDRDALWTHLESRRDALAASGCTEGAASANAEVAKLQAQIDVIEQAAAGPDDARWDAVEAQVFETASIVAACGHGLEGLLTARQRLRRTAKALSSSWPVDDASRNRLYRVLYGARAAIEEVLLQVEASPSLALELSDDSDEPPPTPSVQIEGVTIHSGDLLLSRGGAPTSAFIARGSDHPGNFSHVALVHVSESGEASAVEAHIERGVAVADADAYFADKKLRIAVLRMRPDHPAIVDDPMLPHRAASEALAEVKRRHIPYDFTMNVDDDEERFCSEVASAAYGEQGVQLWQHLSTMSSPGLARWMAGFGVEHLRTHGPSDLEYDPQLRVVAEWHDPDTLFDDHVDNAVIDVMLEQAEAGAELEHNALMLPFARLTKGYSVVLNLFGREGPIPEGMSATTGLRVQWLMERHETIERDVMAQVDEYKKERGRRPPYWTLVEMARRGATRQRPTRRP